MKIFFECVNGFFYFIDMITSPLNSIFPIIKNNYASVLLHYVYKLSTFLSFTILLALLPFGVWGSGEDGIYKGLLIMSSVSILSIFLTFFNFKDRIKFLDSDTLKNAFFSLLLILFIMFVFFVFLPEQIHSNPFRVLAILVIGPYMFSGLTAFCSAKLIIYIYSKVCSRNL